MPVYYTYAWKDAVVKQLLGSQRYTPSIILAEIARKYRREGFNEYDILRRRRLLFTV